MDFGNDGLISASCWYTKILIFRYYMQCPPSAPNQNLAPHTCASNQHHRNKLQLMSVINAGSFFNLPAVGDLVNELQSISIINSGSCFNSKLYGAHRPAAVRVSKGKSKKMVDRGFDLLSQCQTPRD